jgi:hypothetical protein
LNKNTIEISAATIKRKVDGKMVEFIAYQSDAEELIEKVLFYIATQKGLVIRNVGGTQRWCIIVSLYEIRQELIKASKTKSYDQIRESLEVLGKSQVTIYTPKQGTRKKMSHPLNVIQDVIMEYSDDNSGGADKLLIAFSDATVREIQSGHFRQFMYSRVTKMRNSLARFLDVYLSTKWIAAQENRKDPISLNQVMMAFGRKEKPIESERRDMRRALTELVQEGVLKSVPNAEKSTDQEGKADYLYYIEATEKFLHQIIQANAKEKGLNVLRDRISDGTMTALPGVIGRKQTLSHYALG